jgi:hypothetical protein
MSEYTTGEYMSGAHDTILLPIRIDRFRIGCVYMYIDVCRCRHRKNYRELILLVKRWKELVVMDDIHV